MPDTQPKEANPRPLDAVVGRPPPRFTPMETPPGEYEANDRTRWWQDTWRPLSDKDETEAGYPYMAVQVYADKDPNNYRRIQGEMHLLFTDQCEYCVVCSDCHLTYRHMQWSGSTRGPQDWRERAERERRTHKRHKGWCEFCDPVFGNGGWAL